MTRSRTAVNGHVRAGDGAGEVAALRAEIRHTRAELGDTVQALAAKMDVKARMKETAAQRTAQMKDGADRAVERAQRSLRQAGDSARRHQVPLILVFAASVMAAAAVAALVARGRN